ncbi:uncharacterized protein LOC144149214 isoform X2 [Haemaphysalis longicornis]
MREFMPRLSPVRMTAYRPSHAHTARTTCWSRHVTITSTTSSTPAAAEHHKPRKEAVMGVRMGRLGVSNRPGMLRMQDEGALLHKAGYTTT